MVKPKQWLGAILMGGIFLGGCQGPSIEKAAPTLNSRFNDEQPSLSGDGRYLAFVSNRRGRSELLFYDLRSERFVELPNVNPWGNSIESPSLSQTGRYVVFLTSNQGKPEIVLYDRAIQRSEVLSNRYRHWIRHPRVSPDGRYITFEGDRRGQWDIEMIDRGPKVEPDLPDDLVLPP